MEIEVLKFLLMEIEVLKVKFVLFLGRGDLSILCYVIVYGFVRLFCRFGSYVFLEVYFIYFCIKVFYG